MEQEESQRGRWPSWAFVGVCEKGSQDYFRDQAQFTDGQDVERGEKRRFEGDS